MDPAELRMKNLLRPEQFPYTTPDRLGVRLRRLPAGAAAGAWTWPATTSCAREQAEKRARGELMGIGICVLHRGRRRRPAQAHGHPRARHGRRLPSCASTRPARRVLRLSVQTQGQGHETTFAQIVAEELGIPPEDIEVVHGDTDKTPFGLGTYGSRSTPVSGAAAALVARKVREQGQDHRRRRCSRSRRRPGVGEGPLARAGRPGAGQDDPGDRAWPRTATSSCPRASRATSTRRRSTTRRTSPTRSAPTSASSTSTRAPARSRCAGSSRSTTAARGSTR